MDKSKHFFGNSVFGQLISLIDDDIIIEAAKNCSSDHYVKKFKSKDHLITMLFCAFANCNSLREVTGAMLGLSGKTKHFKLSHIPRRSTLSDANKNRNIEFFENVYNLLLKKYCAVFSDSRIKEVINKQVKIVDSSTISLFNAIMNCVGRKPANGKRKGGVKVHTVINADEQVPNLVWITPATTNDHKMLAKLKYDKELIYVFDKGYNDYKIYQKFTENSTGFVTRMRENAVYEVSEQMEVADNIHNGVLDDHRAIFKVKKEDNTLSDLELRKIVFYDRAEKKKYEFLTNIFDLRPDLIAALYKIRWQIELVFKQLKQNYPLKYFLGDNENAIKIQIYSVLIVNLLTMVVKKGLKRSWAFSNLVSFCRIMLFNYINLFQFLENPERDWVAKTETEVQLALF